LELGGDSKRGKILDMAVKYWLRILQRESGELMKSCYMTDNMKFGSWKLDKKLKDEVDKTSMGYV
jgi:hypothetical protein